MFVFDGNDTFLRVETTDPLMELDKLERLAGKLAKLGDSLKLSKQEKERWLPANKQKSTPATSTVSQEEPS
jgi:hypothetical protein